MTNSELQKLADFLDKRRGEAVAKLRAAGMGEEAIRNVLGGISARLKAETKGGRTEPMPPTDRGRLADPLHEQARLQIIENLEGRIETAKYAMLAEPTKAEAYSATAGRCLKLLRALRSAESEAAYFDILGNRADVDGLI